MEVAVVMNAILVVNAGSSSLKLRLLSEADAVLGSADLPAPAGQAEAAQLEATQLEAAIASLGQVDAVGHRIVHGGSMFTGPVLIDPDVHKRLESLSDLAPLHQP
ncbi:MAG: acetate/propionate family kinase, partial [Streptosporangiaceae bacterium]